MGVLAVGLKGMWGLIPIVLVSLVLVAFLVNPGCTKSGEPIHFIVPDSFRGPLYIVEDPSYNDLPLQDGRYVFRFPDSGVLIVKDLGMVEQWHSQTAEWSSGAELPWQTFSSQIVAIRGGSAGNFKGPNGDSQWYSTAWVGTEAEFLASIGSGAPGPLP